MGMDTVELVMNVEKTFDIDISNRDAEGFRFVGDIHNQVIQTLRDRGQLVDEAAIWETLRQLIIDQLGVRPDQVTPTADILADLGAD